MKALPNERKKNYYHSVISSEKNNIKQSKHHIIEIIEMY